MGIILTTRHGSDIVPANATARVARDGGIPTAASGNIAIR
jgi:hypothetical protein